MTSMWMLERADGTLMNFDGDNNPLFDDIYQGFASTDKALIESYRESEGGHLVEMVPAKPKVPVSQEEADMLEGITNALDDSPAGKIANYVDVHSHNKWAKDELRLMQAYVNGYRVVETKRYIVLMKLTGEKGPEDQVYCYMRALKSKQGDYIWWEFANADGTCKDDHNDTFTEAEIEHYGLDSCERVEINTEGSDDD